MTNILVSLDARWQFADSPATHAGSAEADLKRLDCLHQEYLKASLWSQGECLTVGAVIR
jgi:hypothetical protein